ncbi:hypothetical protein BN874_2990006 [Candidatus Contendobacter odensis Run_B_J11]|uniref:Uncharacterized protein n=1 Tax=Candidatus Contendobacter odensis Run_B_J11 TaxID=1400861 RepID=A0A7U7GCZ4_9GAMM|nr:hypothetical protein BN874_2990006 [Candidatus Contendobacter odensis Run_B_J11]
MLGVIQGKSGKEAALLPLPPLRTVLESFPSHGSSLIEVPCHRNRFHHFQLLAMNLPMAIGMQKNQIGDVIPSAFGFR